MTELELFSTPDGYTYYWSEKENSFSFTNDNAFDPGIKFPCKKEEVIRDIPCYWDEMWNWQKENCRKAALTHD